MWSGLYFYKSMLFIQQAWYNDSDKMNQHNSKTYFIILRHSPLKLSTFVFSILNDLWNPGLRWRAKHGQCLERPHGKPSPNVMQGQCNEHTQRTKVCLYIMLFTVIPECFIFSQQITGTFRLIIYHTLSKNALNAKKFGPKIFHHIRLKRVIWQFSEVIY